MSDVDIAQVRAEIAAEVRARRASGAYPPGFEREMDLLFAKFSPREVAESLPDALERSEDAAGIDPEIPVASNNPVLGIVKKVMAKLLGWYHVFVAQQVTTLGVAVNNVLRRLIDKVTALESLTGDAERARAEGARVVPERDDDSWRTVVTAACTGGTGRFLVTECGDGAVLGWLGEAGVEAYGVEPHSVLADAALARGLEVRLDDPWGHLRSVDDGALGGLVLRACTERRAAGELLDLADNAQRVLAEGGRLVVLSAHPRAWGRGRDAVEADLAPGRPLHPATWEHVLAERGFTDVEVHELGASDGLAPVADAAVSAQLARISAELFGPTSYAVVATRSS